MPLFFLELAAGQSIRQGSIGVWKYISPKLAGIGYSSCLVGADFNVTLLISDHDTNIISVCCSICDVQEKKSKSCVCIAVSRLGCRPLNVIFVNQKTKQLIIIVVFIIFPSFFCLLVGVLLCGFVL